ncbi:hypothetical protein BpHYR1_052373 [Brachionus plicatilis]|uniref:Uncharacterized protein n=1 Tax=Brachionus plicatilis TaxID=10195 RepID=A0A3M7QRC9_BRAPC|nr:hypothetical protein BpHYR1_052373 [Brachionus plicatilis]
MKFYQKFYFAHLFFICFSNNKTNNKSFEIISDRVKTDIIKENHHFVHDIFGLFKILLHHDDFT